MQAVAVFGGYSITMPDFRLPDTILINAPDTSLVSNQKGSISQKANKFELKSKIEYQSADSISMDLKQKKAWMYGNASISYEDIKLKAALIIIDFDKNTVEAYAAQDTAGNPVGTPEFSQGSLNFKSKELSYNFTSRKGLIQNVITKEGEGYLHGSVVKKINDTVTNVGKGEYTTCDLEEHPHFSLKYTRAKVITGDKIITGPAYMNIEGVPLPLALPFGLFPNKKGRSSGLIIPRYGESADRGFFLENGGYYFGLNDYFDLKLVGDIYSRGSWAVKPAMSYHKRYKYSGSFSLQYAVNVFGAKGTSDYNKKSNFYVTWSHRQDPKARPRSTFSASVQAGSSGFNKYNPGTVNDYINNSLSSSISYDMRFGQLANFTASARHSQNTSTHTVTLAIPEVNFGISRIYPFKKKVQTGKQKWYENINITYNLNTRNELNTYDSLVFKKGVMDRISTGIKHAIPISGSFKVMKYFTLSTSANYTERWYLKTIRQTWVPQYIIGKDTIDGHVDIDTVNGFKAARDYSLSASLGSTLYGMVQFKKGAIQALRHVVRPSVGYSYLPDFGTDRLGYYRWVQVNEAGTMQRYSIFGGSGTINPLYGTPPYQKSGSVNFGLSNNLEMKIRSKSDTVTGTRKVMLIDNLNFSTSYDLARDSLNWSPLMISGYTTLFKKIQINYGSSFSPYAVDSKGNTINKFEYQVSKKLLRFTNSNWNLSVGYDLKPKTKTPKATPPPGTSQEELDDVRNNPHQYIDWDNQWSLHIDYNFRYTSTPNFLTGDIKRGVVQTLRVGGDVNVTEKWRCSMQTGYDFELKDFAYTSVTIFRDLHCWEMRFNWIPYGYLKSWSFQINAKSSLLQDLKLTKKKDFRDNL